MSETVRFGLTVPTDRRFHEMVRAFSVRVATYLGYADGDAEAIGQIVERVIEGVTEHVFAGAPHERVHVSVAKGGGEMEIRVQYREASGKGSGAGSGHVERWLLRQRDGDVPLELMRRVMARVEFGREEGTEFCRLTRPLPD